MNIELETLAQAVAERVRPAVSIDIALWDLQTCADYLGVSYDQAGRYAARPDFPAPARLPTARGRGTPRYRAREVIAWVERFRERR